jgi:hypothetical protein
MAGAERMNPVATEEAAPAPPRRALCHASLATGLMLGGIAVAAMRIDVLNNYDYGVQISHELAGVMVLAAIGVTALPAAAALRGWDWLLRLGTLASVLLTVWAAISAYADKQGKDILARQATSAFYEAAQADAASARQEIAQARAEAAAIAEPSSIADLEALATFQRELIAKETKDRGGCGTNCRKAEDALNAVLARMPAARAREAALTRVSAAERRLDSAKGEARNGPAEPSMLSAYIARQTGRDAAEIARTIALATTGFAIIVTLLMAGLAHQAASLITQGLGLPARDVAKQARQNPAENRTGKKPALPIAPRRSQVKASKTVRRQAEPATPEERMAQFIRDGFQPGGEASSGDIYLTFEAWWIAHAPGQVMPSPKALSKALADAGIERVKRGGKIRYQAGLRYPVTLD